jgi:hypothetical protein
MNRDYQELIEWEEARQSPVSNFLKSLSPQIVGVFFILLIFGWYLVWKSNISPYYVLGAFVLIVIVMIIMQRRNQEKEILEFNLARKIIIKKLKRTIPSVYPAGTKIFSGKYGKLRWTQNTGDIPKPWKIDIGIETIEPNGLKEELLVTIDPFEGKIYSIIAKPEGYTGEQSKDIIYYPSDLIINNPQQNQQPKKT